jgi:hypothetical protein
MHFRMLGLPAERFADLFTLSVEELARAGPLGRIAGGRPPCRVSRVVTRRASIGRDRLFAGHFA